MLVFSSEKLQLSYEGKAAMILWKESKHTSTNSAANFHENKFSRNITDP